MTAFSVKKGKHRFQPRFLEPCSKSLGFTAMFHDNCLYDLNSEDQADINKLFGITSLFIHKNSARFGWRAEGDKIRIFAYYYRNGIRGWKEKTDWIG